jgi:hypothetical protein
LTAVQASNLAWHETVAAMQAQLAALQAKVDAQSTRIVRRLSVNH